MCPGGLDLGLCPGEAAGGEGGEVLRIDLHDVGWSAAGVLRPGVEADLHRRERRHPHLDARARMSLAEQCATRPAHRGQQVMAERRRVGGGAQQQVGEVWATTGKFGVERGEAVVVEPFSQCRDDLRCGFEHRGHHSGQ